MDFEPAPMRAINETLGHSFYDDGPTGPEWMSTAATINPDQDGLRLELPYGGNLASGSYFNPPPWTGTGDFHLMTGAPSLGEGFIIAGDWASMPAGCRLEMGVFGGQDFNPHNVRVAIEDNQMTFIWNGEGLTPVGPYGDVINDIYESGSVIDLGAPQRYLRLGFDGSSSHSGFSYWALYTADTLSGFGCPTGEIANSELHIDSSIPPFHFDRDTMFGPARTLNPINLSQFTCSVTIEGPDESIFDVEYWDIGGQDVLVLAYPWAVAMDDGEWHGTENLVAARYDVGPTDVDWSNTYPVRLG
jgi:hypothetical protein